MTFNGASSKGRKPMISHMENSEVRRIRTESLHVTQKALASQLISPDTGMPISNNLVCKWETGERAVPLWAARQLKELGLVARLHDDAPEAE